MHKHTKQVSFRLPAETIARLDAIKDRDGIPLSEQIRRAITLWFAQRDKAMPIKRQTVNP